MRKVVSSWCEPVEWSGHAISLLPIDPEKQQQQVHTALHFKSKEEEEEIIFFLWLIFRWESGKREKI